METLKGIFKLKDLRKKIGFTLLFLALYRFGTHITISGVDISQLQSAFSSGVLGFIDLFSGGALSRYSIFGLGILPYINASIIMQLLTFLMPKLKEIAEEGESGRKQISQYTRYLTVALALVQGVVMTVGFRQFVTVDMNFLFFFFYSVIGLAAGACLVMWIGELITEFGLGNGASLLIFISIISQMPFYVKNTYVLVSGGTSLINVTVLMLILLLMVVSIVFVQEAQRKIPVQYAKRVVGRKMYGGQNTYIPLKLVQGGVLPIIFASAVLQFPLLFLEYAQIPFVKDFFSVYYRYDGVLYNLFFCFLIFFFTYFYTAITFNPVELADNLKKYGGFILGVRPGRPTVVYLEKIISKMTLVGATFLALIAMAPIVGANLTQVTSFMGLGGTAMLIIVGVALDVVRQLQAYLVSRRYEGIIE